MQKKSKIKEGKSMDQLVQHQQTINDQLARYVVMRKPEPIDTTTLNYNWQVWETNAFSVYTRSRQRQKQRSPARPAALFSLP